MDTVRAQWSFVRVWGASTARSICTVVLVTHRFIGVGTGGATVGLTFRPIFFLKSFPSFLNTMLMRKTIRQHEESTKLRGNMS